MIEGDVLIFGVDIADLADEFEHDLGAFPPHAAADVVDDPNPVNILDNLS
jgi:hypothetical protein